MSKKYIGELIDSDAVRQSDATSWGKMTSETAGYGLMLEDEQGNVYAAVSYSIETWIRVFKELMIIARNNGDLTAAMCERIFKEPPQ